MSRRGSSYTILLIAMPGLIGSVAMGVDWGQVAVARMQAQAAADEGALAAASALNDRPTTTSQIAAARYLAESRADEYASSLYVNGIVPEVESVELGYYDGYWSDTWPGGTAPNAVEVVTRATVQMSFARFFGFESVEVRAMARAGANVIAKRAPDLVLVQDVTPSMSATDIAAAKGANSALIDCIETYATPDTRGAFVKFANVDRTIVPLVSYESSPGQLFRAAHGDISSAYTSTDICLGSGGCTTHAAGMYAGVSILNGATEPPEDVGQAIIFITDGASYSGGSECTTTVYNSSPSTPYKTWLRNKCTLSGGLATLSTQTTCQNAGGRWNSSLTPRCRSADNGSEATTNMTPGTCSITTWTTEARCEGNGGIWRRTGSTIANPSALTRWADETRLLADAGTWRPIDVYAVFYSAGATSAYRHDNLVFLDNHIVTGKGAELGVLDAPSGDALVDALEEVCLTYTMGSVGLIE